MSILKWELENVKSRYNDVLGRLQYQHTPIAVGDFLIEITANKNTIGCLPQSDLPLTQYTRYQIRFMDDHLVAINPWTDQRFSNDNEFKKIFKLYSDHANFVTFEELQYLHQLLWIYSKK